MREFDLRLTPHGKHENGLTSQHLFNIYVSNDHVLSQLLRTSRKFTRKGKFLRPIPSIWAK